MDWKDAVAEVAKVAPSVATALGGPAAGGITAGASSMITGILGVEDSPAGIVAATQDPEKLAELKRINNEHRQKLEQMRMDAESAQAAELTARMAETQKTMRAELEHEGIFKSGWRPGMGWVFTIGLGSLTGVMAYTIGTNPQMVGDAEFSGLLVWLIATMGATVGINVRERGKDKQARAGFRPTTFMDAIATRGKNSKG